jgi:DNA-binding FrmR family transcriptional regulator
MQKRMENINLERKMMINRLRRAAGQVSGIEKMIEKNEDCLSIIQQIIATRSALTNVAVKLLSKEICNCEREVDKKRFERLVSNLVNFKK